MLARVQPEDRGFYTCTVTFDLGGVRRSMSATIDCGVKGKGGTRKRGLHRGSPGRVFWGEMFWQ